MQDDIMNSHTCLHGAQVAVHHVGARQAAVVVHLQLPRPHLRRARPQRLADVVQPYIGTCSRVPICVASIGAVTGLC